MKVSMQERGKGWINRKEGQSEKKTRTTIQSRVWQDNQFTDKSS